MINFTTTQLSWLLVSTITIGGSGYLSLHNNVQDIDKKTVVVQTHLEHQSRSLDQLQIQLDRIESKLTK
jgi:hypothetical protein